MGHLIRFKSRSAKKSPPIAERICVETQPVSDERPPSPPKMESSFLLHRLPAELRTIIYEYVFTFDSVRCQDGRWRVYDKQKAARKTAATSGVYELRAYRLATRLGPTLVCKQMRAETLHLLMTLNEPVYGNERRDVDLYYEYWMGPRLLVDPCTWLSRTVEKARSTFLSPSTVSRLHLWIYPCMRGLMRARDWAEFEGAFARLVDGSHPGKVVVTLHLVAHCQNLVCEYRQRERPGPPSANSQFEYGVFELDLEGGTTGLVKLFDEKREGLNVHASHEWNLCNVRVLRGSLLEQLRKTEEMAVRIVEMARVKRAERLSLGAWRSRGCVVDGVCRISNV